MKSGDIIFEQDEYKIVFDKNSFGEMFIGWKLTNVKAFHFVLLKNNAKYKFFATAGGTEESIKSYAIQVFKKLMV